MKSLINLAQVRLAVEGLASHLPRTLATPLVAEVAAMTAGKLLFGESDSYRVGAEQRVRGLVTARRLGTASLRLGRRVAFEGVENMVIGTDVALYDGVQLSATGDRGSLRIGSRTHIDRNSVLYGQGGIEIGEGCAIAAGVTIYSQTNRFDLEPSLPILAQGTAYAPVKIGDDVWIGAGAIVLPGATIGDHAVVAAGAVVRGVVESWKIVAGVPARVIRDRREAGE